MKKKSILLLSLLLPVFPLITIVSCSSTPAVDLRISITSSPVTQEDINGAIVDYNKATITKEKVNVLNRLFSGVTEENFANFTVEAKNNSITLTALNGFLFGTKQTIKARVVTVDSENFFNFIN